ncbi:MAG TPA: 30S ribosomal protein S6e [Candidatus Aenigmarchaeota archaeon]|nr:30S ribosomal protein S6e [Candidatus Aenigmarchaeota archaeon]HEX32943.1 30S ribosomal protein S6e [Candidatus Aenigmarchaeota archaeon]
MKTVLVIGTKDGKTYQKELSNDEREGLIGKEIGDKVNGELFGMSGYVFEIRGGSDRDGFPMRPDVSGSARVKPLLSRGTGMRFKRQGYRRRKTVVGRMISDSIAQVNVKVVKYGDKPIEEYFEKEDSK